MNISLKQLVPTGGIIHSLFREDHFPFTEGGLRPYLRNNISIMKKIQQQSLIIVIKVASTFQL